MSCMRRDTWASSLVVGRPIEVRTLSCRRAMPNCERKEEESQFKCVRFATDFTRDEENKCMPAFHAYINWASLREAI